MDSGRNSPVTRPSRQRDTQASATERVISNSDTGTDVRAALSLCALLAAGCLAYYLGYRAYYEGADGSGVAFAAALGAVIVAIAYGTLMAFLNVAVAVDSRSKLQGTPIRRLVWVLIFAAVVAGNALVHGDIAFAIGFSIAPLVTGVALSVVIWGISRGFSTQSWTWFDWMNAWACSTALLAFAIHFTDRLEYLF